jgi:hypothetical protein
VNELTDDSFGEIVDQLTAEVAKHPERDRFAVAQGFLAGVPNVSPSDKNAAFNLLTLGLTIGQSLPRVRKHFVILIHGIRTTGAWAEMAKHVLDSAANCETRVLRYDYVDLLRFSIPGPWRRTPGKRVLQQIQNLRSHEDSADISVICHSFGTYILCNVLLATRWVRLKRIILCGSIVPREFPWADVVTEFEPRALNECGTKDLWPLWASLLSFGYGPTGTHGFGDVTYVCDRFHKVGHGGFFDEEFIRSMWVPFILTGKIEPTDWDRTRPPPGFLLSVMGSKLAAFFTKTILAAAVLAIVFKMAN